ncbi:hypothetical protein KDL44_06455 [bacterium]|nr:hypothetical protein [bacterium]
MPVNIPVLKFIGAIPNLPFFARLPLRLAVRLGLLHSTDLEVVLRYLDTADEAISWWPPLHLMLLCGLLLLLSVVLLIASLIEFIFRPHPLWLAWTELLLANVCLWAPPFVLAAHYAAKVRMLYAFASEESVKLGVLAREAGEQLRERHEDLLNTTEEQFDRIQAGSRRQWQRMQDAGSTGMSRLRSSGQEHGTRLRSVFSRREKRKGPE